MSKSKLSPRHRAALKRTGVAKTHGLKAIAQLNAMMADISPVNGLNRAHIRLRKAQSEIRDVIRDLVYLENTSNELYLDHDPQPHELHCGHGPTHGCGIGSK